MASMSAARHCADNGQSEQRRLGLVGSNYRDSKRTTSPAANADALFTETGELICGALVKASKTPASKNLNVLINRS
jgi:hypothetical protein